MTKATLSEMASKLAEIDRNESFAHEEVDTYCAPTECHGLVSRGMEKPRREAFQKLGWTPKEFGRDLRRRVSIGSIYRLGFLHYLDVDPEDVARRMMEKVRGLYDDPETAGERIKAEIEEWACCLVVCQEVHWAMTEVRHLYDTSLEAAEDMKQEVDRWVDGYTVKCPGPGGIGGCGRPLAYCACP